MAPQAKAFGRLRRVAARRQPARAAPRVSRGAQAGVEANEGKLPGAARRARGGRVRLGPRARPWPEADRKSTRLNSSHVSISYAVFCLKKKKIPNRTHKRTHKHPSQFS